MNLKMKIHVDFNWKTALVNFIITNIVLFVAWKFFPDIFWFKDTFAVFVTSTLLFTISCVFIIAWTFIEIALLKANKKVLTAIFCIVFSIGAIIFGIFGIKWMPSIYEEFVFNGRTIHLIILALVLMALRVKEKK